MAKRAQPTAVLKVTVTGGQANPAPPLGPTLSQHRVNISEFIGQFNERTKEQMGVPLPVVIRIYRDGSFEFDVKHPPVAYLLKRAAGVAKGAGAAGRETAGEVTPEQVRQIAQEKLPDLNTEDLQMAERMVEGTARSCGIAVAAEGEQDVEAEDSNE